MSSLLLVLGSEAQDFFGRVNDPLNLVLVNLLEEGVQRTPIALSPQSQEAVHLLDEKVHRLRSTHSNLLLPFLVTVSIGTG